MILTCPKCASRFTLPAEKLAPDGCKVKCSSCDKVWFQEPDPEELAAAAVLSAQEDDDFLDDAADESEGDDDSQDSRSFGAHMDEAEEEGADIEIPRGLHPDDDDDRFAVPPIEKNAAAMRSGGRKGLIGALAISASLFVLMGGALVGMKDSLVRSWVGFVPLYEMIGMQVPLPGEGVVFDRMRADTRLVYDPEGPEEITLSGSLINLTSGERDIPLIEAKLENEHGHVAKRWMIEAPVDHLKQESFSEIRAVFEVPITKETADSDRITLSYVLGEPTAETGENHTDARHETGEHEAGHGEAVHDNHGHHPPNNDAANGGNNPAHHQDDHAPRHAHEADVESLAPDAHQSHQEPSHQNPTSAAHPDHHPSAAPEDHSDHSPEADHSAPSESSHRVDHH